MKGYDVNILDIETFTENDKVYPYCICIKINGVIISFWYDENIVLNFLNYIVENSKSNIIQLYAHNINFDGVIILDGIKKKNIFFDMYVREHSIYWIKIIYCKIEILIRCSYKIIPLSINYLGKLINSNKRTFPYKFVKRNNLDYDGNIPDSSFFNTIDEYNLFIKENSSFNLKNIAISYCIQDIEIIHRVLLNINNILLNYLKIHTINNSFSFSSISYKIFSKKFDKFNICSTKNLLCNHEYIKNSYHGGRCEVFGNPSNDEIIHYFDFKGMYAQCMLEKFPYGEPIAKNNNLTIYEPGFHTIKFKCNSYLPFLPYKYNKLLFPNGNIIGTYWYEEIINALKYNKCEILNHYSSLVYSKEEYLFKDYINEFMNIREKGLYYNLFGKNMINGMYGSFALNDDNSMYIVSLNESEFSTYQSKIDILSFKKIGNSYIIKIKKNSKSKKIFDKKNNWNLEYKKRNIAYAAIISAKARIKLNNSLQDVINDGGNLFYTDTDSIFAGYKINKLNSELGNIKWSSIYKDGIFISSKFYFLKDEMIKLKGINRSNYTFDEIKYNFLNNTKEIIFDDQFSFLKSDYEIFELYNNKKININNYDKRIFIDNKKKTIPIVIPD